ncbi:MAG: fibronectin type III domain-containing protein [Desulfurivibrionaceae bacterium]
MKKLITRAIPAITSLSFLLFSLMLVGCGGGGGEGKLSSEIVSGTAAVGAALAGEVTLKDSSATPQYRKTVISSDGTFAFDVTGLQAPFLLRATGSAEGKDYTLHSYAEGSGTANVNPLSEVIVASAAEVDEASEAYERDDSEVRHKIRNNLAKSVNVILNKLQPLLERYNARHQNPITSKFIANHLDLDEMFDNVKFKVKDGVLSIINEKTGAVIYTGKLSDIANGNFYPENVPPVASPPDIPVGLTATGGAGQVSLAWTAVGNATSYNVYYATTPGVTTANGTKIPAATNSYNQTGLPASTSYYYIVTALNNASESVASEVATATTNQAPPQPTAPVAPAEVTAVGGTNQVTISWAAVSGATSYNLYWSKTSGVTKANGTKIANATSPAVSTDLTDGTAYYYIVTAINSAGESTASIQVAATTLTPAPVPTAPAAPTGLTATGGATQVSISWLPVPGATSYNLYRSTSSGVTTATGTRIAGVTSPYVNTGLAAVTSYYYLVTAVNSVGESVASTKANANTDAPLPTVPAAPTGVSATGGANQVTVSWSAVPGSTSYNLYWSSASGVTTATGTKVTAVSSPYPKSGLADGSTYYFIVTAINSAGESAASTKASATTNAAPVLDGLALYNQYCLGCHATSKLGKTASATQGAINANTGGMGFLSTLTTAQVAAIATTTAPAPTPPPACGSCHAIPPAVGRHSKHSFTTCATCHGTGYSSTTVNTATHANGTKDVGGTSGWNATSRSCANSCHGSRTW